MGKKNKKREITKEKTSFDLDIIRTSILSIVEPDEIKECKYIHEFLGKIACKCSKNVRFEKDPIVSN